MGPVSADDLKSLLQQETISRQTKVWHEGRQDWASFEEVEELQVVSAAVPPPLPEESPIDWTEYALAGKWKRFFARLFDFYWEVIVVGAALGFTLARTSSAYLDFINTNPSASVIFGLCVVPLALVFDALVCAIFGNSPGKAMLGVKPVKERTGERLSSSDYFKRNGGIWVFGLGFSLPLINLFTMANQAKRLDRDQKASYDENTDVVVKAKPIGWARTTGFLLAFMVLFSVQAGLLAFQKQQEVDLYKTQLELSKGPIDWKNPETGVIISISPEWTVTVAENDYGGTYYQFLSSTQHAMLVLGAETLETGEISDYVTLFREGTKASMQFTGPQEYSRTNQQEAWVGSGILVGSPGLKLSAEIRDYGSEFWRVIVLQDKPYDFTDEIVDGLKRELWKSIPAAPERAKNVSGSGYDSEDL